LTSRLRVPPARTLVDMSKRSRDASVYEEKFMVPQIRGDDLAIDSLKGKVCLVVNTASH